MNKKKQVSNSPITIRPSFESGFSTKNSRSPYALLDFAPLIEDITSKMNCGFLLSFQGLPLYTSTKYEQLSRSDHQLIEYTIPVSFEDCDAEIQLLLANEDFQVSSIVTRKAILGEVAIGMAHDLRNVLTGIGLCLGEVSNQFNDPQLLEPLNDMFESLKAGSQICNRIMRFGCQNVVVKNEYLREIVESSLSIIRPALKHSLKEKKAIKLIEDIDPVLSVYVSNSDVQFAIVNIVLNAINHGIKSEGTIIISANVEDQFVCLSISNDGEKISEEVASELFVRPLSKSIDHGYGLYISKLSLVKQGGDIRFETNESRTTFFISLPYGTDE